MKKSFSVCRCVLVREKEMDYTVSNKKIVSSADIAEIAKDLGYDSFSEECFGVFCINAKGDIVSYSTVSQGDLCSTVTHPREVFKRALLANAGSVVFVHNHPSGDCNPSEMDLETTKTLMECGKLLQIPVLDHIIIGNFDYYSMRMHGDMK